MTTDRLRWWEKVPLSLALLAQSYVVSLWYFASVRGAGAWADLAVAIGAGLALDLVVITTVMGRRQGRSSGWSWATSFGAFCCSALIALDRYGWEWRSLLHVAFPLVVFLYSQHLATPQRAVASALPEANDQRSDDAQERSGMADAAEPLTTATAQLNAPLSDADDRALEALSAPLDDDRSTSDRLSGQAVIALNRYPCPFCGGALVSGRALGAAKTNGYCQHCKQQRSAA